MIDPSWQVFLGFESIDVKGGKRCYISPTRNLGARNSYWLGLDPDSWISAP